MKITVFQGRDGQWYWNLKARNGQVMAQSEGYTVKGNADRAATRMNKLLGSAAQVVVEG